MDSLNVYIRSEYFLNQREILEVKIEKYNQKNINTNEN